LNVAHPDPPADGHRPTPGPVPLPDASPLLLVDPRHVTQQRIAGLISTAIVSGGLFVAALGLWLVRGRHPDTLILTAAWVVATPLLLWLALGWPPIAYRYRRYRLDDTGIDIRSGVLWRETIAVPRSRVQHIDVVQGPLERRYGLATLTIHTAGTRNAEVPLPGLAHDVALTLRAALLPTNDDAAV
jgi:membrane protein YdbS with pleckstrin-like domain